MKEDKQMKRGDYDYRLSSSDISYFRWKDNKCVNFCSNFHGTEMTSVSRKQKDGSKIDVPCPTIVSDYNKHMGAVDYAEAMGLIADLKSGGTVFFFGFIDIVFVNTFILYSQSQEEKMTLLDFRRSIAMGLINKFNKNLTKKRLSHERSSQSTMPKRIKYNYSVPNDLRLSNRGSHWVTFVKERGRCENCSSKAIQCRPHSKRSFFYAATRVKIVSLTP